jgi:DNA-binding LytR/AlgR family response regulator
MIKIYTCDDDFEFLEKTKSYISAYLSQSNFSDFECEVTGFNNPENAMAEIEKEKPDIVFLDIDMPKINGFNIAGEINRRSDDTLIIFVTNYDNYVYTSIKYRPFRFIRKSKIAVEIKEALRSALNEIIYKNKYLELGVKYFNEKIFLSDVIYIESKRNYAELNATNGEKYKYRSALSKLEDELKSYDFVRIHAGYLVNMRHIHLIKDDIITLSNGEQLNISRRLHKSVLEQYREYMRR